MSYMHFFKTLSFILMVSLPLAWGGVDDSTQVRIKNHGISSCGNALISHYVAVCFKNKKAVIHIGKVGNLRSLLKAAKFPSKPTTDIVEVFEKVKTEKKRDPSILGKVIRWLEKEGKKESLLLVGVIEKNYQLYDGVVGLHVPMRSFFVSNYTEMPFVSSIGLSDLDSTSQNQLHEQVVERHRDGDDTTQLLKLGDKFKKTGRTVPNLILLAHGNSGQEQFVVFFHEATHEYDFHLLTKWVKACVFLKQHHRPTDVLFKTYSRMEGNQVFLDNGFSITFQEVRAYHSEFLAMKHLAQNSTETGEGIKEENQRLRAQAMAHLTDTSVGGIDAIVSQFVLEQPVGFLGPITESNIFELGDDWGAIIEDTIARAKALKQAK